MELSSFSENIVSVPFERSGEKVTLEINIDAFTPEFFRQVGKKFQERMKEWETEDKAIPKPKKRSKAAGMTNEPLQFFENEAKGLEIKRQIYAELLSSGVLKSWDVTENGIPLAPSCEVLMKLPPLLVEGIWNVALDKAKTVVKKRVVEEVEETSENSPSGTRGTLALAPTG